MRALRKARGSQLLASASVMRSTAPPSRKASHVGSLSGHAARITDLTQKTLYFTVFRPKITVWPSLGRRSRWRRLVAVSSSDGGDAAALVSYLFSNLFYSLEMIHILVTCVYIVTCCIYILFVHRRQIVSVDAPRGVSKDSKTIYSAPMEWKFGIDFM